MAKENDTFLHYFPIHVQYEVHILGKKKKGVRREEAGKGREVQGRNRKSEHSLLEATK